MRSKNPVEPRPGLGFRAAEAAGRSDARSETRLEELEGVAVEYQVDRALAVSVDAVEKALKVHRPPEVLARIPRPSGVAAFAHVQVADDDNQTRASGLR